jgi:predicted N-acetyltransferase YhbS
MLEEANDAEKRERDRLAHAAWGQRLTVDQFVDREERLRAHRWSRENMRTWLLREGRQIVASCETFRMVSFVRGRTGWSHGVASVYVAPELRGRGYAARMMQALIDRLSTEAGVHASILFSDVGPALYQRAGYEPRPAQELFLPASPGEASHGVDLLLRDADVPAALPDLRMPADPFVVWPTADQIDWHLERERIYAELLGLPRVEGCGARAGRGIILWAGVLKTSELHVLSFDAQTAEEAAALIAAAQAAAAGANLARIQLWTWPDCFPAHGAVARTDSLPMIRRINPEVPPSGWHFIPRSLWI